MRYIIDFINTVEQSEIDAYFVTNGCAVVKDFSSFERTFLVEASVSPPVSEIVEEVVEDSHAPLQLLDIQTKTFPIDETDNWWKLSVLTGFDIDQPTATIARAGEGVRLYCMDSGIDIGHAEFTNKDITLLHSVIPGDFTDTTGHGTSLASVMVGETCGISEASLKVVKIFHEGHSTLLSDMLDAFDAVGTDYVQAQELLAVLNLSWAVAKNTFLEGKINHLIDLGVVVVTAAGNDGRPISDVTPGGMARVITAGSFGKELIPSNFSNYTASDSDTSFTEGETNYGAGLDCFAPGEHIRVALPGGGYGTTMGTSIAAAITSTIFALRIKSSGFRWDLTGAALGFQPADFLALISVRDVLTLTGNYSASPNVIPSTNISTLENRVRSTRLLLSMENTVRYGWLFSNEFYENAAIIGAPEWATLEGNFIVVNAPAVDAITAHEFTLTVEQNGDTLTYPCVIVVAPENTPTGDIYEEMQIHFLANGASQACLDQCLSTGGLYCCQCCGADKFNFGGTCEQCAVWDCPDTACF